MTEITATGSLRAMVGQKTGNYGEDLALKTTKIQGLRCQEFCVLHKAPFLI